jgi:hypothetical protein
MCFENVLLLTPTRRYHAGGPLSIFQDTAAPELFFPFA